MTKKKKSNRSSQSPIATNSIERESNKVNRGDEGLSERQPKSSSFLELRVSKSSSQKWNGRAIPKLTLTEEDALELGAKPDDHIFVLPKDGLSSISVCIVKVSTKSATNTTPRSAATPTSTNEVRITRGSCQLEPSSLLNTLFDEPAVKQMQSPLSPMKSDGIDQQVDARLQSPSNEDQSTPTKGFSFTSVVSSPSPKRSTPQQKNPTRSPVHIIQVIPFQSKLGKKIVQLLCQEAAHISISSPSDNNTKSLTQYGEILSRLFMAYCEGRFVRYKEVLYISFRGQPFPVTIENVTVRHSDDDETTTTNLGDRLARLSLKEEDVKVTSSLSQDDDNEILQSIMQTLTNDEMALSLRLFRVTSATKVVFRKLGEEKTDKADDISRTTSTSPTQLVAGLSSVIEQVRSLLLTPLLHPDLYIQRGLPPPRGLLLHGPSGVGKSLLARQLALDFALTNNVRVQHVNCASLQSQTTVVGEAEQQLIDIFRLAEKRRSVEPATAVSTSTLLILDDIHLICPRRSGKHVGVDRLASTLLALMDGLSSSDTRRAKTNHVVILALTSNPSLLDPAVRRPGRLDAEVEVPIPDEGARAEILKFQLSRLGPSVTVPSLSDGELMALSRLAKGFNGADCMLALKEAQRAALLRDTKNSPLSSEGLSVTLTDLQTAIRAAKPSTINSITVEIPQVPWSSIGGMDSVKEQLKEALEFPVTHAHLFRELRIPPPRGVLLYGPPGCSKTLMARALATEGHMNFLAVKGPELLSKWLGESERALASLFRRARMASPCIIFFDEIDAIAPKRGYGDGSSASDRLLSQLLTELDGVGSSNGSNLASRNGREQRVVVVGATNRPDLLDSALTRPGRIDKMIYVGVPDEKSRAKIFEIGLKGRSLTDDIDIEMLASDPVSGGISGAEAIAVCRDAALLALEEEDATIFVSSPVVAISMRHLLQALKNLERQITTEMLDFYGAFHNK